MVLEVATLTRVGVVAAVIAALGFAVSLVGPKTLRNALGDRFLYGVPWGSLLVIGSVFAFYLFAQSGLRHWDEPVTLAFRNWAYPYATGMLTSGFAHVSPSHLLGNMLATVVLAPLAEFIWGHYPHEPTRRDTTGPAQRADRNAPSTPAPTEFDETPARDLLPTWKPVSTDGSGDSPETDSDTASVTREADSSQSGRFRDRPVVRALVIFPGVVFVVSLLTSLYALGWSLGFSGTVFAFLGFVLLKYPIATAVALLGVSLLNTLLNTLLTPVLRATAETGPPRPPGWAAVNVQAHMLGFLVGVLLALALLWNREDLPDPRRLFLATVLVAFAQGLWQLSAASDGVFVRYQGLGVVFVLLLAILVTYVTVSDNSTLAGRVPTVIRGFGALWVLGTVGLAAGALTVFGTETMTLLTVTAVTLLVALPGALLVVPDGVSGWEVTTRRLLFVALVFLTVVIALPSAFGNSIGIDGDTVPDGEVTIEDYQVSYAENVSHGRTGSTDSGLVVVSEERYIWNVAVDDDVLAHRETATVPVGGIGWRATVTAERTGWNVVGNDSVYVVDLETDETSVRSFASEPSQASVTLDGAQITLAPTDDEFVLTVTRDGEVVGSAVLPEMNETATAGDLTFTTEERDRTTTLFVSTADSRVVIAQKE